MTNKSIYNTICENITDAGWLPQGFLLLDKSIQHEKTAFVPGARDGLSLIRKEPHLDRISAKIVQYMKSESYIHIAGLLRTYRTLQVIDPVIKWIQNDHEAFDAQRIIDYAYDLVFDSQELELVKFGIALLGMFDFSGEPQIIKAVIALGLYEEFTLFSIVALRNWENGNAHQFLIAQRVKGWGKIHAVELLDADTDEIRDWLLRFGCKNDVMNAYLGLTCAVKGNMIDALRRDNMDEELFEGISVIMDALLSDGPVAGMKDYAHAQEALQLYLQSATKHAVTLQQLWHVLNIKDWLAKTENEYNEELLILCACIADRPRWRDMIKKAVVEGDEEMLYYAVDAARRLQMDITSLLFKTVIKKPVEYSAFLSPLFVRADFAKKLAAAYEKILPLNQMATGMGEALFAVEYQQEHQCLMRVLAELGPYPNLGEQLLQTALQSPVIHLRNCALSVLEKWSEDLWVSVFHISPAVGGVLKRVSLDEVDTDTRMRMVMLLNK